MECAILFGTARLKKIPKQKLNELPHPIFNPLFMLGKHLIHLLFADLDEIGLHGPAAFVPLDD